MKASELTGRPSAFRSEPGLGHRQVAGKQVENRWDCSPTAAVANKMVSVETRHIVRKRRAGRGQWTAAGVGIEDWSECLQDREEMVKDDRLQAVGVPGRGRVREGD